MSWQDMGLYWAWRGAGEPTTQPPTEKLLEYADMSGLRLCIGVFDGRKYTPLHRDEAAARGIRIPKHAGHEWRYLQLKADSLRRKGKDPNNWRNYWPD